MGRPLRLLLIEDSEADAELETIELRRSGFDVAAERVDNATELERALRAHPWDLVLCDHGLPGFSSSEALRQVRAHDGDLPFVILSGTIGEEAAVAALKSGARDVVLKTNLPRLGSVADRELREAAARRDHRAAVRALQDSEGRKTAMFQAAIDAILAVDRDGRIVDVNPAAESLFATDRRALLGRSISDFMAVAEVLAGDAAQRVELPATRADGTPFPAEVSVARGQPSGSVFWTVFVRDLTARRRAEAERNSLEAQLRQSQKMEAIGRLAGGITHDFNNILAVVNGYSDMLLARLEPDSAHRSSVEAIKDAGQRARTLTTQLLSFTRQQPLEPTTVDLNAVIGEIEPMLQMLLPGPVRYGTRLDPDLRSVRVDANQLAQVIMNLVVNACDAMPDGGELRLETANADFAQGSIDSEEAASIRPGRYAVLSVSDTGIGMDADTRARIFEPFYTTKDVGEGTGLGLSTVYGIVNQSDGAVWVHSELGGGTTFKVYLPSVATAAEPPPPATSGRGRARPRETVLLVEHDAALLSMISRMLADQGYAVFPAADGEEALRTCAEHGGAFDILLTDVVMPGMDGVRLARTLHERHPEMRLLFMSGYAGDRVDEAERRLLGAGFLAKPFDIVDLTHALRRLLDAAPSAGPQ